jgi:hypothetical protein
VPSDLYFGQVICPAGVVEKINSKHGITEQDVVDLVQWPASDFGASWIGLDDDPRGPRAVVVGRIGDGRRVKVVLYPVDGRRSSRGNVETAYCRYRDMRVEEVHHGRHELA